MIVGGGCDRHPHKSLILVNSLDDCGKEKQELCVFGRCLAGIKQVQSCVCGHGPVVVLAASVYTGKGLLMEQADKTVAQRDLFHYFHGQLVVIGCYVGCCEYRGKLMLCRSHLVVLGLG